MEPTSHPDDLHPFERQALRLALRHEPDAVRAQADMIGVGGREEDAEGVFILLRGPHGAPHPGGEMELLEGRAWLAHADLDLGGEASVWARGGQIELLELRTYGEPWPRTPEGWVVSAEERPVFATEWRTPAEIARHARSEIRALRWVLGFLAFAAGLFMIGLTRIAAQPAPELAGALAVVCLLGIFLVGRAPVAWILGVAAMAAALFTLLHAQGLKIWPPDNWVPAGAIAALLGLAWVARRASRRLALARAAQSSGPLR